MVSFISSFFHFSHFNFCWFQVFGFHFFCVFFFPLDFIYFMIYFFFIIFILNFRFTILFQILIKRKHFFSQFSLIQLVLQSEVLHFIPLKTFLSHIMYWVLSIVVVVVVHYFPLTFSPILDKCMNIYNSTINFSLI